MNLPTKNRKWLKEIQLAFSKAEKEVLREELDLLDIYQLAPKYMAKNRDIVSTELLNEMLEITLEQYARELPLDPAERESYLFHFVMYYVHCHEYANILDGMACDRVMEYIMQRWDLWPNKSVSI